MAEIPGALKEAADQSDSHEEASYQRLPEPEGSVPEVFWYIRRDLANKLFIFFFHRDVESNNNGHIPSAEEF